MVPNEGLGVGKEIKFSKPLYKAHSKMISLSLQKFGETHMDYMRHLGVKETEKPVFKNILRCDRGPLHISFDTFKFTFLCTNIQNQPHQAPNLHPASGRGKTCLAEKAAHEVALSF